MFMKIPIRFHLVLLVAFFGVFISTFTQTSMPENKEERVQGKILIAKGESGLEYNVVEIIKKHFQGKDYNVQVEDIKSIGKFDINHYKAVLMLHAIHKDKLPRQIRKSVKRAEDSKELLKPYLFISTIAGENWLERETSVDAITSASSEVDAAVIAERIIEKLEKVLEANLER